MSKLPSPNPISQIIAFSLFNQNAYDEKTILNLITNNENILEDSFIPMQQLNYNNIQKQSFSYQMLGEKKIEKLFSHILPEFKNKDSLIPQWDDLIAPNVYSLSLMHTDFSKNLSIDMKHDFLKKAKFRFLIGNLIYKPKNTNYEVKDKVINLLPKEDFDNIIEESFIPFDMTFKDFTLLMLLGKAKDFYFKLQERDLRFLNDAEKESIIKTVANKKTLTPIVLSLLDNTSVCPFIFKKIGVISDYNIDKNNIKYVVHNLMAEPTLSNILNNLSGNHQVKKALENDIHLLKEIWPIIWDKFTHKSFEFDPLSFNKDPEKVYTVLYKLGILKGDILDKDKNMDYFLSHFMLHKATPNIIDNLMEQGLYTAQWLKTYTNHETWKKIIDSKTNVIYVAIQDNLKLSVFDIAPNELHGEILEILIESCSEYNINHAVESTNFDMTLMDKPIKVKNKPATLLHKLLVKGHENTFIKAISKGANYNIPVGNSVLDYMEKKVKYESLLKELKPLLLYNEFQDKIPQKEECKPKKLKI